MGAGFATSFGGPYGTVAYIGFSILKNGWEIYKDRSFEKELEETVEVELQRAAQDGRPEDVMRQAVQFGFVPSSPDPSAYPRVDPMPGEESEKEPFEESIDMNIPSPDPDTTSSPDPDTTFISPRDSYIPRDSYSLLPSPSSPSAVLDWKMNPLALTKLASLPSSGEPKVPEIVESEISLETQTPSYPHVKTIFQDPEKESCEVTIGIDKEL